tara:strand:- start:198 stop:962 length:765 start_codon:yes stop_codon:yes gene_type:complete
MKPVCFILGAGAGIGGNVAKKFAREGYHSHLMRRTDKNGLNKIVDEIKKSGGTATSSIINAVEPEVIENQVIHVEKNVGPINVGVFNLGAQVGNRSLPDTSYKIFERGWRMSVFALYRFCFSVIPYMVTRGEGTILVTASTAAVRGNKEQHSHAAAMGARRMLCQSLNAEFAPKGIHVVHIVIDGAVDAPDTLGKMLGSEAFQKLRETKGMGHDGLILPQNIADTYFHLTQQHRSTWTHEIDIRAYSDLPWWNH